MKIFISYRRADNSQAAGRIYDKFVAVYGHENVFKDVDSIPIGSDFKQEIDKAIAQCDFLIVVIGERWLSAVDGAGRRRLDNPSDLVRIEIESALNRNMGVIPLFIDGATMPAPDELQPSLQELAYRNGAAIRSDPDFHRDMDRVIRAMDRALSSTKDDHGETFSNETPADRILNKEIRKEVIQQASQTQQEIICSERGGYELICIPAGTFIMGSPETEEGHRYNEAPAHEVHLSPFYMGIYPVTNEQYGQFLSDHSSIKKPRYWRDQRFNQPYFPVVGVNWNDVQRFAQWAGLKLPTEAQWEYACRAGTTTRYYTGDSQADLNRAGWYRENSDGQPHPVGQKEPNAWGLYDMHGNVWEWCQDWYDVNYYTMSPVEDPQGPDSGDVLVVRGGFWFSFGAVCRSATRFGNPSGVRDYNLGFRLVKSIHKDFQIK